MILDPGICYRALRTRDGRFDGRFFTAVRSTGVYCRPICPAPTPKRENCSFFACAAAAQEAGFRPCLRCRPEASPGTPAWLGTSATVSRALRLLSDGALDTGNLEDLAARLGVGGRHLRRLFAEHLGASPVAVAQTRRIFFAKRLIDETDLSMTELAFASGFSSVRRFNDVIRRSFGRAPRELRRARSNGAARSPRTPITLKLQFRPPYDWNSMIGFLGRRAVPGVESAGHDYYRRTIVVKGVRGVIEIRPAGGQAHLVARIFLASPSALIEIAERARRLFDLEADPGAIGDHLAGDPRLAPAVAARPGVRVPGAWDGFELSVRAILGQQVSVKAATQLAARLVREHGEPLELDAAAFGMDGLERLFPTPERLAGADLGRIGVPGARARAISGLATAVARGDLMLDSPRGLDEAVRRLVELPGIGEWTAQYIAMRALREPDAFPATDLGLRRALTRGGGVWSSSRLEEVAEAWRPWRAYAAMMLWMADGSASVRRKDHGSEAR